MSRLLSCISKHYTLLAPWLSMNDCVRLLLSSNSLHTLHVLALGEMAWQVAMYDEWRLETWIESGGPWRSTTESESSPLSESSSFHTPATPPDEVLVCLACKTLADVACCRLWHRE